MSFTVRTMILREGVNIWLAIAEVKNYKTDNTGGGVVYIHREGFALQGNPWLGNRLIQSAKSWLQVCDEYCLRKTNYRSFESIFAQSLFISTVNSNHFYTVCCGVFTVNIIEREGIKN